MLFPVKHSELSPEMLRRARCRCYANTYKRRGLLIPQPCEVPGCSRTPQMHHDDYDKPLEVRWICLRHHKSWHRDHPSPPERVLPPRPPYGRRRLTIP